GKKSDVIEIVSCARQTAKYSARSLAGICNESGSASAQGGTAIRSEAWMRGDTEAARATASARRFVTDSHPAACPKSLLTWRSSARRPEWVRWGPVDRLETVQSMGSASSQSGSSRGEPRPLQRQPAVGDEERTGRERRFI